MASGEIFLLCRTGKQSHCRCRRDLGCPALSHHRLNSKDPHQQRMSKETNC